MAIDYKNAGVDVEAGYKAVELMKGHVKSTMRPEVVSDIGGFGGLFSLAGNTMEEPILVSGTDGVGTKLKIAFELDKHDTIGIDCVAMCVNDIICAGAEPLFFLDYIACGKNKPEKIAKIVEGIATGCKQSGAALIGGETAEMPGFYPVDEYDVAGFAVGIVDKKNMIDGKTIREGDVLIGLPSTGIHSNGYSLVRKIFESTKEKLMTEIEVLESTLGEALITPTKIYVKAVKALREGVTVKGLSHITGGGFVENIPRMLPEGLSATIHTQAWTKLPIFDMLQELSELSDAGMYNTFNMGIGMVAAVSKEDAAKAIDALEAIGETGYVIGEVVTSKEGVILC